MSDLLQDAPLLPVDVVPGTTCFCSLPLSLHRQEPPLVLAVTPEGEKGGESIFLGWGGGVSRRNALEMPTAVAEALGVRPNQQVKQRAARTQRWTSIATPSLLASPFLQFA